MLRCPLQLPLRPVRHRRPPPARIQDDARKPEQKYERGTRQNHRPPGRARPQDRPAQSGLRGQRHPGRRLRSVHHHRLRSPQEIRPAPDHRRHAGDRRSLPLPAHHSHHPRLRPRSGGGLSRRLVPQLRQPDVHPHRRPAPRQQHQERGLMPFGTGLRPRPAAPGRPGSGRLPASAVAYRRHQPPGLAARNQPRRQGSIPAHQKARRRHPQEGTPQGKGRTPRPGPPGNHDAVRPLPD